MKIENFFLMMLMLFLICISNIQRVNADNTKLEASEVMINADRLPPKEVEPIKIGNIKYEVLHWGKERGLDHNGGYVFATDIKQNKELWVLKVYSISYNSEMEEDVQDVFIESMSKVWFRNKLKIIDENGEKYLVDLDSKLVTKLSNDQK